MEFGSHSLGGFRVAANTVVVWGGNLPVGNGIKTNSYLIFRGLNRKHVDEKPIRKITCH